MGSAYPQLFNLLQGGQVEVAGHVVVGQIDDFHGKLDVGNLVHASSHRTAHPSDGGGGE